MEIKLKYGKYLAFTLVLFLLLTMCVQAGAVFIKTKPFFQTNYGVMERIDNDGFTTTVTFKDGDTISFPTTSVSNSEWKRLFSALENGTTVNLFVGDDGLEI